MFLSTLSSKTAALGIAAGLALGTTAMAQCGYSTASAKDSCESYASDCSGETTATITLASTTADHHKQDIVATAKAAGSFGTLLAAAEAAGLVDALKAKGPLTVFAPTDEAFAKLGNSTIQSLLKPENRDTLTAILTYHVVSGRFDAERVIASNDATTLNGQQIDFQVRDGKVMVDNATVVSANVEASNGVIHVIDSVILPESKNLVEVAQSAGSFTILAQAVQAAGLAGVLTGDDAYTVFAPTDEAFRKLPAGTLETLLKPENRDQLVAILTYHVVPGRVYARDAVNAQRAETAQGGTVRIDIADGRLQVNDAGIVATDIEASNGVIHVIDSVILPQ
ncbi:MAG: fasciclin domain-containing protein [Planctomycetota bacterium]